MVERHLVEGHLLNTKKTSFETFQLSQWKKCIGEHQIVKASIAMYRFKQWISPKLSLRDYNG